MGQGSGESPSGAGGVEESPGGTPAPASATFETVNLFGRRTGHRVAVRQGETLPALPRGFSWVVVEPDGGAVDRTP